MTITRAVILDLWAVYATGEASPDTRALVEEFLRSDSEFDRQLRANPLTAVEPPPVPPDVEMRAFTRAKRRLGGFRPLLFMAMLFSCSAFGRIVSDTSWDVSPRNFVINAVIALAFWIAFFVSLWRMRARILIVRR
jgi:hypothetical protein